MLYKWFPLAILIIFAINLQAARKALVIGNSDYIDSPLRNPVYDAQAVERLLKGLGFDTTLRVNQDKRGLEQVLDSFAASLQPVDEAVFYYSGHGAQVEGENFLIPVGKVMNDEADVKYDGVSANKATEKLSRAAVSIVVLDACRDNPYRGVRSGNKGLALMPTSLGRQFIIYSTASGQTAADGGSSGLSPFTEAFVRHAATPGLPIEQMMHKVNADLRQATNNKQVPFTYGSMDQAYYLAKADSSVPQYYAPSPPVYTQPAAPQGMVYVEGGSFMMGSNEGGSEEKPVHRVNINSFYIGKYEVIQKEWVEVMGSNPSNWEGNDLPVENISWYDAVEYCNMRSIREGLTPVYSIGGNTDPADWSKGKISCDWSANGYRLPTEAEWEFAARGGMKSKGYKYSGSNDLGSVAWYSGNAGSKTHSVGGKSANELGIYDMNGNVWEWCWDWYAKDYYGKSPGSDPKGPDSGEYRVLRGGSWYGFAVDCRVAIRLNIRPGGRSNYCGLRLARAK